ncbi:MAG: hypothetical protein Q4E91_08065 [Lachnospiraceae bacterium]|nr:hypothetical protein [Lachnospiraceae bacterium]
MKKNSRMILNTGTTSLILIFTVLALVVFALLSLSSANVQWKLAQKMAERTTQYYEGENEAAKRLYQVGEMLEQLASDCDREAEFLAMARKAAEETEGIQWENGKICWQTEISEKQQLRVEVLPVYPQQEGAAAWRLDCWKLETAAQWENRQTMELFQ